MLLRRATIFAALGLAFMMPLLAGAQTGTDPATAVLAAPTNTYFTALEGVDTATLDRVTAPLFHFVRDGQRTEPAVVYSELELHRLSASTPVTQIHIGTATLAGSTATENVTVSSYDNLLEGDRSWLERDTSAHVLTWTQAADGTWLLSEDRITSANHFI